MRKSGLFGALLMLAIPLCVFSQSDYRKGFVITLERDTLHGFVNYVEGVNAHKQCSFRTATDQEPTIYLPQQITGYGFINGRLFESRTIKTDEDIAVFLEMIVMGRVSLYRYDADFWIEKDDHRLHSLKDETHEEYRDGKLVVVHKNTHIGLLSSLLFDCVQMRSRVPKVTFSQRKLSELILSYNACMGQPSQVVKTKKSWTKVTIGISGGVNIARMKFESGGFRHLSGTFEAATSPIIGITLDIASPRINDRLAFTTALLYSSAKHHNYVYAEDGNTIQADYVTIKLSQLKIPLGIKHTFPQRRFTPFVNLGVSGTFHLSKSSIWIQEIATTQGVTTSENPALEMSSHQLGYWGGAGLIRSLNNVLSASIELRYERTDGIVANSISSPDFTSRIKNIQVLFALRLK